MITAAIIIGDRLHLWNLHHGLLIYTAFSIIALSLIAATVLTLGWVEDLAARRPPRIWPLTPTRPAPPAAVPPAPRDRNPGTRPNRLTTRHKGRR
jgi:hypothetical protein